MRTAKLVEETKLATKSKAVSIENYENGPFAEKHHGLGGPRITANGAICIPAGEIYMLCAFVDIDKNVLHGPDVAVNTCS